MREEAKHNGNNPANEEKEALLEKIRRFLFGDDIFISYSRADSTYALALANELIKNNLSCFLDQWGTPPGEELPQKLINTIKRCSTMVLVGSKNAGESDSVGLEITEFLKTERPIIPITFVSDHLVTDTPDDFNPQDLTGTLEQAKWYRSIQGIAKTNEISSALKTRIPSENVISRIVNAAKFRSRSRRLRKTFFSTLGAILLLLIIGGFAIYSSYSQYLKADDDRKVAETNAENARQNQKNAESELVTAQQELSNTNKSLTETESKLANANTDLKNAEAKVDKAESQLTQTKQDLATSQTDLTTAKTDLGNTKTELDNTNVKLQEQIAELTEAKIKTEAAKIASSVGQDKNIMTPAELTSIRNLSTALTNDIRYSFIEQVLASPASAVRFSNRAALLTHATIGFSEERKDYAINNFILPRLRESSSPFEIRLAVVDMGVALGLTDKEWASLALPVLVEAIEKTDDQERRDFLAGELIFVTGQLNPEQVTPFFKPLIEDAKKEHWVVTPGDYKVIEAVITKVSPAQEQAAFTAVIDAIAAIPAGSKDAHAFHFWATALSLVPGKLSSEHRRIALDKLISNSNVQEYPEDLVKAALRQNALEVFAERIDEDDALGSIDQLMTAYDSKKYGYESINLSKALKILVNRATPGTGPQAMDRVLRSILNAEYSSNLNDLFPAIQVLREKMTDDAKKEKAGEISQALLQSLQPPSEFDSGHFTIRLGALGIISPALPKEEAEKFLHKIISVIDEKSYGEGNYRLPAQTLFSLVKIMNSEDAHRILINALRTSTNTDLIGPLVEALSGFEGAVSPNELELIYGKLIGLRFFGQFGPGLKSIGRKVPPDKAKAICTQLLSAISSQSLDENKQILAEGMTALPGSTCDAEIESALQIIARREDFLRDEEDIKEWNTTVQNIPGRLTIANSQRALEIIIQEIVNEGVNAAFNRKNDFRVILEKSRPEDMSLLISWMISTYTKEAESNRFHLPDQPPSGEEKSYFRSYLAQILAVSPCESNRSEAEEIWQELLTDNKSIENLLTQNRTKEHKEHVRSFVKDGLLDLTTCLSSEKSFINLGLVLDSLESPANDNDRDIRNRLLPLLAKRISKQDAPQAFDRVMKQINMTTDSKKRDSLIEAVKNLPDGVGSQTLFEALNSPFCVGPLRSILINKLGKETGNDFGDDIWTVIKWTQVNRFNMQSQPKKPSTY